MCMQRRDRSTGCILLTQTGIFLVQAGDLKVFKASPWGSANDLKTYQTKTTHLNPKATQLYDLAHAKNYTQCATEFKNQCSQWLLHMLLSDIQTTIRTQRSTPQLKTIFISLITKLINKNIDSTTMSVLEAWIPEVTKNIAMFKGWTTACPFRLQQQGKNNANPIIGLNIWDTGKVEIDNVFKVHFQYDPKNLSSAVAPLMERQGGKWAYIGNIKYSIV